MYPAETQESIEIIGLSQQLQQDASGELRDGLIDKLQLTAEEIEIVIGCEDAMEGEILKRLLEAVRLSERIVVEVWNASHGARSIGAGTV